MDSFFRDVEVPPYDDDDHLPTFLPEWTGPPWHWAAEPILINRELGRSDTTVILLDSVRVFPRGMLLRIVIRISDTGRRARNRVWDYLDRAHGRGQLDDRFAPAGFRWGIAYSDGRRITTQDESPWAGAQDIEGMDVAGPVLEGAGRPAVFADSWTRDFWVWPLPPLPTLQVAVEWPARDVLETLTAIDVQPLLDAAQASRPLWPTARSSALDEDS